MLAAEEDTQEMEQEDPDLTLEAPEGEGGEEGGPPGARGGAGSDTECCRQTR